MPPRRILRKVTWVVLSAYYLVLAHAQTVSLIGLRALNHAGAFHGLKADASGNLYTLYDAKDGVRLLKFRADGSQVLAETQIGQAGDTGIALDVDSLGFVAVAGTSTSNGSLLGTAGTAFPNRSDSTTNSFVARFTPSLSLQWLSFVGSGKTAITAVSATSAAIYATGGIYAPTLPVTPGGIQQSPAPNSSNNGFVESFSAGTGTLNYATYLTGANGDTQPSGIVADAKGNAYIVGTTSASGFPTTGTLVPVMRTAGIFPVSGFLTKLTPAGDGFVFSTFVPGEGLASVALDANTALLVSGNISSGLFPITVAQTPMASTLRYQSALRLSLDGTQVLSSTLLTPSDSSLIVAGTGGQSWIFTSSSGGPPLLPLAPLEDIGNASVFRITSLGKVDRNARVGGVAVNNSSSSSIPVTVGGLAVAKDGTVSVAGTATPTVSSSLISTQAFDFPLVLTPNVALTSSVNDAMPLLSCGGSACTGSAGLLARLAPDLAAPQLALSVDNHPNLTLRNLGAAAATGVQITASGYSIASTCGTSLEAGSECNIALIGSTAGSLTVQATNSPAFTTQLPVPKRALSSIAVTPRALNLGIVTAGSSSIMSVLTVHNFSSTAQTFSSQRIDNATSSYAVTQTSSTCAPVGDGVNLTVVANGTCTLTLTLTPSASSAADGPVGATWQVGSDDVAITGYAQAAAIALSATTIDFGRQFVGGIRAPRYLYLSNSSDTVQAHAATASTNTVFAVVDECPANLQPHSICRIALSYLSPAAPSSDAFSMAVDGADVTVLGETLPQPTVTGASVNPNLSLSAQGITFTDAVTVTSMSTEVESITVSNTGTSAFALALGVTGDFSVKSSCPAFVPSGASCVVIVAFTPSAAGVRQGLFSVAAGSAAPVYVPLSGTGTAIFPQNNGVTFGDIPLNTPAVLWLKVQRAFVSSTVISTDAAYQVILVEDIGFGHGQPFAASFTPSATGSCLNCWLGIQFTPSAIGQDLASISFSSSPSGKPANLIVTGNGVPSTGLTLTPRVEDFGPVPIHSSSASTLFQLTNATSVAVTTTGVTATGDFSISNELTGAADCNAVTLEPGASCLIAVGFAPAASETRAGQLKVASSTGTASATLVGTGGDDPGISFLPGELRFDNVPSPTATQQTITLTNTSNATENIGTPLSSDSHFIVNSDCATLAAGAMCALTVRYTATDSLSAGTLTVPVTSAPAGAPSASNYVLALSGRYTSDTAGLQIVPGEHSTVNFGTQATGTISAGRVLHVNNLTSQALTVNTLAPREFAVTSSTCSTLAPNGSCDLTVQFTPITTGDTTGTVFLQGIPSDGSALRNGLGYLEGYGLGVGSLSITGNIDITGVLRFGQVPSGQSATETLTVTNPANATTTVTVRRVLSDAPFQTTTTCGEPLTPGQSCTLAVRYAPTYQVSSGAGLVAPRLDTSSIIIQSDAANTPLMVNLAGQVAPLTSSSPGNGGSLQTVSLSQGSLTFGSTAVGSASAAQTFQVANVGSVVVHVFGSVASRGFAATSTCDTLQPGATCTVSVVYQPQIPGTTVGSLELRTDSVSPLDFVSLVGTGGAASVALAPQTVDFGRVLVGSASSGTVTLSNTGSTPVTVNGSTVAGTGFSIAPGSGAATACALNGTLQAAASCTIPLVFAPGTIGSQRGTLSVATSATAVPLTVALSGVGTQPELVVTPTILAFGTVAVGNSATLSLTLRNVSAVAVNGLTFSATPGFTVTNTCGLTTLTPGSSCAVSVTFSPIAAGAATGSLIIGSEDPASPVVLALSGTASASVSAGSFTLTVNGAANGVATVQQGMAGVYSLTVTPANGFSGTVALTCSPDSPAQYAACSLLPAAVTLSSGAQTSVATITTVTAVAQARVVEARPMLLAILLPSGLLLLLRRRRAASLLALFAAAVLSGCGSGGDARIRYTPAGTYSFHVTASSTTGTVVAQTVTLTLVVTPK